MPAHKQNELSHCKCCKCGKLGTTRRPRPDFKCVRCFVEDKIGRPITPDDIQVVRTQERREEGVGKLR